MGLVLSAGADRRQAVQALIEFAFQELGCVHLEMMDRTLTVNDLGGLDVQYRVYRGFEIDLTRDEDELFSNMTSACRRCVRKAEKELLSLEQVNPSLLVVCGYDVSAARERLFVSHRKRW